MNEYFSHDYRARTDKKITLMSMKHGLAGIGAYWCIIEMLYEEAGYLPKSDYERIAFELRTNNELIKSVVEEYDLFKFKDDVFYSESVIDRLKKRMEKSEKARNSINKRWNKQKNSNTNV